jgi:hypothetical protein
MNGSTKEEITNDGVKILEEVFGKASVGDEKEESKSAGSGENGSVDFGPVPPKDDDYSEEDIKKAEEFKTQGNDFFKSKYFINKNVMFNFLILYFCVKNMGIF